MSVLVLHDYFGVRGGAERLALDLAKAMAADLMFGYRTSETYGDEMFPGEVIDLRVPSAFRGSGVRLAALSAAFARRRRDAALYSIRVVSGNCALFAVPEKAAPGRNVFYCHSPARYLYDQASFFAEHGSLAQRLGSSALGNVYRRRYERAVGRMHVILANSETVRRRIKRYLGRDSTVVHPPVDVDGFRWRSQGDYYLSTARLSALKRVDAIVNAFRKMPDKTLIVASGGEEAHALRSLAGDARNISFTGWVSEPALRRLIGESIATIYVPVDEDFGMSPVESMAAGKPCISVSEGGPLETMVAGQTGILLRPNFEVDDLVEAVHHLTPQRALEMRGACEAQARLFSRKRFIAAMRDVIDAQRAP